MRMSHTASPSKSHPFYAWFISQVHYRPLFPLPDVISEGNIVPQGPSEGDESHPRLFICL